MTNRVASWPIGHSTLIVDDNIAGQRLDHVMSSLYGSLRDAKEAITQGLLTHNGAVPLGGVRLAVGDVVCCFADNPALRADAMPLVVLYEDPYLLAVCKPAGIPMYPGPGWPCRTLANGTRAFGAFSNLKGEVRAGVLGRLDREVSGVVMVARDRQTHQKMIEAYLYHRVTRRYLAIVSGDAHTGSSTLWLQRKSGGKRGLRAVPAETPYAIDAETHWRVLGRLGPASLLEVLPKTGRRHQIRIHLAAAGLPILGDRQYGGEIAHKRSYGGKDGTYPSVSQVALHLDSIRFTHPWSNEELCIHAPWPKDFPSQESFV